MNRMYTLVKAVAIATLAITLPFCMAMEGQLATEVIEIASTQTTSTQSVREVTFTNNIGDICHLIDGDDEVIESVATITQNISLSVNGTVIGGGESVAIPVVNNTVTLKISCARSNMQPLLKNSLLGFLRFLLPPIASDGEFTVTIPEDKLNVDLLSYVIDCIDKWRNQWWSRSRFKFLEGTTLHISMQD